VKQVGPGSGTVPRLLLLCLLEGGQPAGEVGPTVAIIEVTPSAPSSILVKRKSDDVARSLGSKKSKVPMSLCAMR